MCLLPWLWADLVLHKRQNLLFFDVLLLPFSYQRCWWKLFFFFSDTITCVGHFAASRDQAQWPGARPPCTVIPLSPSPGQLSRCIEAISAPGGQWEWSLPLKKGAIYGEIMVKPTHRKGQTQTWEWQGMVSALCQAPWAALPWGTAGEAGAEDVPMGGAASHLAAACLPHTAGPECSQRLLAIASKCPPRTRHRLWYCVANKWHWHRCSRSQRCVGRGLCHHEAVSHTTSYLCAEAHTGWQCWCQQRG